MNNVKKYKLLIYIFLFVLIEEIIFSFLTYKNFSIYHILFSLLYSSVIYFLYLFLYNKKTILYFLNTCIFLIFISNYLYFINYLSFIRIDVLFKSIKVVYFSSNIFEILKNNICGIVLLLVPFVMISYLIHKDNNKNKFSFKYLFALFVIYLIPITIMLIDKNDDIYAPKNLYSCTNFPVKNLSTFGVLTSIRLDYQRYFFGFKDKGSLVTVNDKKYNSDEYNIVNLKFKDTDNDEIKEINNYISNREPTKKNIYTGLLKDKNVIFILAESFNSIAINKDITPNLYRLYNEGFTFDNFYNPLFPVSTADGQYMSDISLFPSDIVHSLENCNKNYYPYSLANVFSNLGYGTYSYHNYLYDYYNRDKYYPNMGFDVYKGIGNGLNMNDTRSDYDMVNVSIDEFINKEKFMTYYLTISGHAPYNNSNKMAIKNYDKLSNYNYSDTVKYYLSTQIELDKMIGLLFERLEKAKKLEDTVIILVPDHVPYGLTIDEMNEVSTFKRDNEFEKYRSALTIYNKDINKYKSNDNYCSNIDILPTILNLFGVEYDSRLMMGRDILSNNDGMVVFGNRNIVTKDYKYSNMNEYIDGNISLDEIKNIKNDIYMKYRISRLMLENDYYIYLFKD